MNLSLKKHLAPNDRMLRQFAILWIVFFATMAVIQEMHHQRHILAVVLGIAAVIIGPLGLLWPRTIRPIFVGWMLLASPIGWIISHAILAVLFYLMFSPIALLFRVIGRDALALKRPHGSESYWILKPQPKDKLQYLRQF